MNDTLMNQCRREAEERYPMPVFASVNYVNTTDLAIAHAVVSARQEAHVALLYAERSKRPPMITVEEAIDAVKEWVNNDGKREDEPSGEISLFHGWDQLRARLTAAATKNTNDNG